MLTPQKENGYTAIANELMEALIKYKLPSSEIRCLLFIIRKTYGYNKKTDAISLSQFVKATSLNRKAVARALKSLNNKNLIYVEKGGVKNDTILTSKYRLNKRYKSWVSSVKNDTGSVKNAQKVVSKMTHTKDTIQKTKEIYKEKSLGIFEIKTFIPKKYEIQPEHIDYAKSKKLNKEQAEDQFEAFKLHHQAKGTKYKSWYAAYQTWIRNSISFGKVTPSNIYNFRTDEEIAEEKRRALL
jgi:phage replication O-like protein O